MMSFNVRIISIMMVMGELTMMILAVVGRMTEVNGNRQAYQHAIIPKMMIEMGG
jgi:hypothetical protein